MATLSDVLGRIVADVARAQVTADLTSMDILSQYRKDDLLRHLDVPRVAVRNIDVKVHFIVDEMSDPEISDDAVRAAEILWGNTLRNTLADTVIKSAISQNSAIRKRLRTTLKSLAKTITETEGFELRKAMDGRTGALMKCSVNYVLEVVKKLPANDRRLLPNASELRSHLTANIKSQFGEQKAGLEKFVKSKSAAEADMTILVDHKSLAQAAAHEVLELNLSLNLDSIREHDEQEKLENG